MARKKEEKNEKTNVMRILEQKKIPYQAHNYEGVRDEEGNQITAGMEVARVLGQDPEKVFKTLVTRGSRSKDYFVFVIPVTGELDLKKAAKAVGEKAIAMIKSKELLPLTGYVHGGCSPVGMKKTFRTTVHRSAEEKDTIMVSAGRIGRQVELAPADLRKAVNFDYADLT